MTRQELLKLFDTLALGLELGHDHFPTALVDGVLAGLPGDGDAGKFKEFLAGLRDFLSTEQSLEVATLLDTMDKRRFVVRRILRKINKGRTTSVRKGKNSPGKSGSHSVQRRGGRGR